MPLITSKHLCHAKNDVSDSAVDGAEEIDQTGEEEVDHGYVEPGRYGFMGSRTTEYSCVHSKRYFRVWMHLIGEGEDKIWMGV